MASPPSSGTGIGVHIPVAGSMHRADGHGAAAHQRVSR